VWLKGSVCLKAQTYAIRLINYLKYLLAGDPIIRGCAKAHEGRHIKTLYLDHTIDLLASLDAIYYKVPFPKMSATSLYA
jgi:hypothetical protein